MLADFFSRREVSHSPEGSRGKRTGGQPGGDKTGLRASIPSGWGVLAQHHLPFFHVCLLHPLLPVVVWGHRHQSTSSFCSEEGGPLGLTEGVPIME